MKYSIVIPTYNHCDDLLKPCIESILAYSNIEDIELIVSANGCTDNTLEYLGALSEKFTYLGLKKHFKIAWANEPLGYSGACNPAIKLATTDLIILLNNDAILLPHEVNGWLNLLESPFISNPKCGISCIIKGHSEPAGRDFAVFFCVMIHKKVFDSIGLLSMDYGVGGGEDTEFCIEAENAGFEVCEVLNKSWDTTTNLHIGEFPIYHKGEGTMHDSKLVNDYNDVFLENSLTLARKYNPDWYKWRLSNYWERAVFFKGDPVYDREVTRYRWAAENLLGTKVFELGCTSGYGIQFFPNTIEYTGLDYDKYIIKAAKDQDWGYNAQFINADINNFELYQYDTIVAFEVIEHLENGLEIVERLKKHCKRLMITVPMLEPPGKWGPHHKLHMLDESYFPSFKFKYIAPDGRLLDDPLVRGDPENINLMLCIWDKDETIDLSWLKEQDANMHREVIESNQYNLTKEELTGRSVIDVGANIGAFSLLAGAMGAKKVIGIEPVSKTFNIFQSNVKRSGLSSIIALKNVVAAEHGKYISVSINNDNAGANSMYNITTEHELVRSLSLPILLKMIEGNNILLKLDCEGAEYDIILNATQEEMNRINEIVLEIHTDLHPTYKGKEIIENKLKEFGFTNLRSDQIYWYEVDHLGNKFNWKELPYCNQRWKR
jgi:FkbM family methyltransferase